MSGTSVTVVVCGAGFPHDLINILGINNIKCQIVYAHETPEIIPSHIIVTGANSRIPNWILDSNRPILSIGSIATSLARQLGATVNEDRKDYIDAMVVENQKLQKRRFYHYQEISSLPSTLSAVGTIENNDIVSFTDHKRIWGIKYELNMVNKQDVNIVKRFLRL